MQLLKREASLIKINLMFNVDITVKNNRTSLFRQLISRGVCKTRTGYLRMADADEKMRIVKGG